MSEQAEAILREAWRSLCETSSELPYPRGFWPDVARVAVEMALQSTFNPVLDFRPTRSGSNISLAAQSSTLEEQLKTIAEEKQEKIDRNAENPFERF